MYTKEKAKVNSFTVDHTKLKQGIYAKASATNKSGLENYTTYDIRMIRPNSPERMLSPEVMHTLEHCFATEIRTILGDEVIYVGPMGCCTGFYVVLAGTERTPENVAELMKEVLETVLSEGYEVPFQNPISCGNYTFMDFSSSKQACVNFLNLITAGELAFEYPYIEEN
ncbi:S-ribosylhomocysteine lyase [Sphingobacterium sp.]|jgi:S-ribosylhomocysteine lyase|uniref:S-ribosylhomocysteine lyase n=1 Tax=Sphingobacterium sp. TaxID=341027 RepID=UPI00289F85F1|nr:S-ribosylhomocysteine lyase [Sphingobacterium sp.]